MQLLDIYVLAALLGISFFFEREREPLLLQPKLINDVFLGMLQRQKIRVCGRRGPLHTRHQKSRGSGQWTLHLRGT